MQHFVIDIPLHKTKKDIDEKRQMLDINIEHTSLVYVAQLLFLNLFVEFNYFGRQTVRMAFSTSKQSEKTTTF